MWSTNVAIAGNLDVEIHCSPKRVDQTVKKASDGGANETKEHWIYDVTIGQIPYVGPFVGYVAKFLVWTSILCVTAYCAAKAGKGEMMRLPYLGEQIERVPF